LKFPHWFVCGLSFMFSPSPVYHSFCFSLKIILWINLLYSTSLLVVYSVAWLNLEDLHLVALTTGEDALIIDISSTTFSQIKKKRWGSQNQRNAKRDSKHRLPFTEIPIRKHDNIPQYDLVLLRKRTKVKEKLWERWVHFLNKHVGVQNLLFN